MLKQRVAALTTAVLLAACHTSSPDYRHGFAQVGLASWYGADFHHKRTANGERFDMYALTAAHRTLPLNSYVRVTVLATGRSVVVRINDRGPYVADRIIDLSARAARDLGMRENGVERVRVTLVSARETSLRWK
jgi:rare lipoprotein A